MTWHIIQEISEVEAIRKRSFEVPCLIFKHSTRCSISTIAKLRLEDDWDFSLTEMEPYYLDLIAHREVSNYIATTFGVHHESPQILLIRDGECQLDASHLDIDVAEIHTCC